MSVKRWYRGKLGEPCPEDPSMAHADDGPFVLFSAYDALEARCDSAFLRYDTIANDLRHEREHSAALRDSIHHLTARCEALSKYTSHSTECTERRRRTEESAMTTKYNRCICGLGDLLNPPHADGEKV